MGWLTGWSYRKNHFINPVSGAGQNYQKRIVVHFGSGTDSDENVYLSGKCKTDFGDVRFTDGNGVTLLKYWIEEKVNGEYAIMWVKVNDDLGTYPVKIYIYYGANKVADDNGNATFIFFDDFETDLSKWNVFGSVVFSTDYVYSGIKSVKLPPLETIILHAFLTPADNKAVHVHFYDQVSPLLECAVFSIDAGESEASYIGVISDIAQYEYWLQGTVYNSGIDRTVGWHEFVTRSSGGLKQFIIDGNLMPVTGTGNYCPDIHILASSLSQVSAYWDAVFARKFINPEPSHGTWGIEESGEAGHPVYEVEDVVSIFLMNPLSMDDVVFSLPKIKTLIVQDPIFSLLFSSLHVPISSEDIVSSLARIKILTVEDIISSLVRIKTLTVEDVVYLSSLSFHVPISSEDITYLLSLSFHVSISSEDIVYFLLAQRLREVLIEFEGTGITDVAYI